LPKNDACTEQTGLIVRRHGARKGTEKCVLRAGEGVGER